MRILGLQLLIGDFLARSVRGLSCAPPPRTLSRWTA